MSILRKTLGKWLLTSRDLCLLFSIKGDSQYLRKTAIFDKKSLISAIDGVETEGLDYSYASFFYKLLHVGLN